MQELPTLFFYMPVSELLVEGAKLPLSLEGYWKWHQRNLKPGVLLGRFHWVLQTYLALKDVGCSCVLTEEWPEQGIVLAHRDDIPEQGIRRTGVLLICLLVDRAFSTAADLHVVHNPLQAQSSAQRYYIPPWPQIDLLARSPDAGDRFNTAAFVGYPNQLDPLLREDDWQETCKELGLRWRIVPSTEWNDYREIDVLIAVRRFDRQPDSFPSKSAIKLLNAWSAGVPVIVGRESAFRACRKSEQDFLEVNTLEELRESLLRLKEDSQLRAEMIANGRQRAESFSREILAAQWVNFLRDVAAVSYRAKIA